MPTVPIYIRVDDLEKWKSLTNKSEFIHNALNVADAYKSMSPVERETVKQNLPDVHYPVQPIKTKEDLLPAIKQLFPDAQVVEPLYRDKKNKKL